MTQHTAQHRHDMQDAPNGTGATKEWNNSRQIVDRCKEHLEHHRWLHKATKEGHCYTGPSVWEGMTMAARKRQDKLMEKVHKLMAHHESIVWKDSCRGCGEYSAGKATHNNPDCRSYARFEE